MNRELIRGLGLLLIGAGGGFIAGKFAFEKQVREEYNESLASALRAIHHRPHTINVYAPAATEEDLGDLTEMEKNRASWAEEEKAAQVNIFDPAYQEKMKVEIGPEGKASAGGELTREDEDGAPEYINHYKKALEKTEIQDTPVELFVDGGINDYGVSYIEEDEYFEEDGRFKGQIILVQDGNSPTFFMDGVQIQDWAERVGDSIAVDFYNLVPPNAPPILYVRNHKRDEDYEVTREIP